ncbi:MAG: hypothetical protein LBR82_00235 [Desulfovibrio sp.]|jgi:hypothetical protein|nr:hypothetical protein [Desulfovibrio sp.]
MPDEPIAATGGETQPPDTGAGAGGQGDTGAGMGADTLLGPKAQQAAEGVEKPDEGPKEPAPGEGKAGDKKEPEKPAEDDPAAKVPDKPEGYEIKFAEETQVDEAMLSTFKATAHELGLSQGQSQKLASMYEAQVGRLQEAAVKAQQAALGKVQLEWEAKIKADKDFAQKHNNAMLALRRYGSPELTAVMDQTRIGSFPAFFDFVAAVGGALAEPGFKGSGTGGGNRTFSQVMYPDMK